MTTNPSGFSGNQGVLAAAASISVMSTVVVMPVMPTAAGPIYFTVMPPVTGSIRIPLMRPVARPIHTLVMLAVARSILRGMRASSCDYLRQLYLRPLYPLVMLAVAATTASVCAADVIAAVMAVVVAAQTLSRTALNGIIASMAVVVVPNTPRLAEIPKRSDDHLALWVDALYFTEQYLLWV